MKPTPVPVRVLEGLKQEFHKRHRKDRARARNAWRNFVQAGARLSRDPTLGEAIPRRLWPERFRGLPNLHRLALVQGFRALCTVI